MEAKKDNRKYLIWFWGIFSLPFIIIIVLFILVSQPGVPDKTLGAREGGLRIRFRAACLADGARQASGGKGAPAQIEHHRGCQGAKEMVGGKIALRSCKGQHEERYPLA